MKLHYLIIIIILCGCGCKKESASKLYTQSYSILSDSKKASNVDSLKYSLHLINKAISLDSTDDYYYLTKAYALLLLNNKNVALNTLVDRWNVSKQTHGIAVCIGALYEQAGDTLISKKYYSESLATLKQQDTTNVNILLDIKHLERLLNDSVDFSDALQLKILNSHPDTNFINDFKRRVLNQSREELINEILR